MFDNIIFQAAITVVLLGYVSYTTYKSVKLFLGYKKSLPDFLNSHKEAELFTDSPFWWIATSLLAIFAIVMIFVTKITETEQVYYYQLAYLAISIVFVGLALETYVRKRVYLTEDGIYYVGQIYRYRMMANFEVRRGIVQNIRILMNNKEKIEVSKKMGKKINEARDTWKSQKNKKKR